MSKYIFDDSYIYYPGTDIPQNLEGIKDRDIIQEIERTKLFLAYQKFHKELNQTTIFDQEYFTNLHASTFKGFYDFAGKYRNQNIIKDQTCFCQAKFISQEMKRVFNELATENYLKDAADLSLEKFARRLAYYSCELVAIHPFYECNGRIIRLFVDMIATYNGYDYINYPDTIGDSNPYIDASKDCMSCNYCKMFQIILTGLVGN